MIAPASAHANNPSLGKRRVRQRAFAVDVAGCSRRSASARMTARARPAPHERRCRQRGDRAHARARLPGDRHQPAPFSPDDADHRANPCCGIPAMDDARMTCARIGILLRHQYGRRVPRGGRAAVRRRVRRGAHPNPCLECNRHVKFRHPVERAKLIGADCLATGHYARIERGDPAAGEPHRLLRASTQRTRATSSTP